MKTRTLATCAAVALLVLAASSTASAGWATVVTTTPAYHSYHHSYHSVGPVYRPHYPITPSYVYRAPVGPMYPVVVSPRVVVTSRGRVYTRPVRTWAW